MKNISLHYLSVLSTLLFIVFCGGSEETEESSKTYRIHIVSSEEWGGTDHQGEYKMQIPEFITVHHSGEDWDRNRDPREFLVNLQKWSRSEKEWIDIPYHYVIDFDGNIYAARNPDYPGDTNTDYDTEGHLLTCLIGNYENLIPNDNQIEALINVLTWQCQEFNIKPGTLKGHKDYTDTACPGKNLYPYIANGYLLKEINTRLGNVILEK